MRITVTSASSYTPLETRKRNYVQKQTHTHTPHVTIVVTIIDFRHGTFYNEQPYTMFP